MSQRRPRSLALRPLAEDLEGRRLLAATFRGLDLDGDAYTLRLAGPGDLRVTQINADGTAHTDATTPALIDQITIAGADPSSTRLVGRVTKGAAGDGKVFFDGLSELGGRAEGVTATLGVYAIDTPNFWLGATRATATTTTPRSISIPDGVVTLRFGGVDTTYTPTGHTPLNQNNQADSFSVNLGIPRTLGTSIIVDQVITSAQAATTATGTATQDGVTFIVTGRINLFQANAIQGSSTIPFSGFQNGGGTIVASTPTTDQTVTGQIGFVRIGGNATNFSAQTNDKVSNFYVGGETANVTLLAPNGSRNVYFGKGMDQVTIRSHYISSLYANRGAVGSTVLVDRNIGQIVFGGDVVNTTVTSGVEQNLVSLFQSQTAPTTPPLTQDGGAISQVLIAGNVRDSTFSASVDPSGGVFGTAQDLVLPHGNISAKVEGTIDNAATVSDVANRAFFAHSVKQTGGPVQPPNVPEAPFPNAGAPPTGQHVVRGLQPSAPAASTAAQVAAARASIRKAALGK